ncbi:23S rRNA (uracil(1939)-C(5))-methyltransferase RlmD [Chryseolinea lacunae]|uniref:23S rRNA (Uracil(1939)-C(5))-methyltransferase RlmD n=1 Tax=Chryseolinea lacunae TaxID=2801331 RepID=A0ABS1KT56_9BACT|nr:23S rRNA (uracil(1939)-C(5))-methyltransferase RlmD [Chryseolinea lacunae]MBL0742620.1 23S rRNA (uracil(1939)-C(5))-methyltransferase RlmD [Chryseolinea lacunae]
MKKGDVIENLVVETMAAEGKCVSRLNGLVVFLEGGAPGDTVDVQLTKIKSSFLEGKVTAIKQLSPTRAQPFCEHFGLCGGCSWQHIQYEAQLQYKQQQVVDNLTRLGGLALPPILPIVPSAKTRFYRNKLDYTFSAHRWLTREEMEHRKAQETPAESWPPEPALGYHIPRKYDLVFDVNQCHLQPDPSNGIRLAIKDEALKVGIPFFDLRKQIGFLRTITIRTANTGEVMIILQVTYDKMEWTEKILRRLEKDFPQITSFNYIINGKKNDTFHDLDIICWKGNPYITEHMPKPDGSGTLQFRVGPKSFYQTNSDQAYQLYKLAWEMADLKGDELVYDLYTGTGTIANFVAAQAKKVVGLEYVAAAIEDAKVNSQINNIGNTDFYAGDMKDLLKDSFLAQHGTPDTVITDPPRAGMHEDVCRMLLKAAPQRIVYVSCNPATQARDLGILSELYDVTKVQPVDMFPHTVHVEDVVRLERRN